MKQTWLAARGFALLLAAAWLCGHGEAAEPPRFESLAADGSLEVFLWKDVVNVYVLRIGDAALLVDLGDGSVLDHLGELGVRRLEWVLLTHHHREQCQGHRKLATWKPQVAAPEKERALVERPADFRKMRPSLGDPFTVHGASYVRPPVEPLAVQRGFKPMDTFTWQGREFWCLETAGNSPGSMSYLLKTPQGWLAFSGDAMLSGARMHNWFDTEWDYGFAKGLYALVESVSLLESFEPALLLPSHGPIVRQPTGELHAYQQKLRRLARLYVRGYAIFTFAGADQDKVSRPSAVPHLWQTTPHLFKFKGPNHSPNAGFLLADSGRALMIDCGVDKATLDTTIEEMQRRLGLKGVDAVLVTHMHGDHVLGAPYLRERWGAKLWTLDRVAPPVEQPERFDYAAQPWSYGRDVGPIKFDRLFKAGEKFAWEGYELTVDWMPGQTEFGCAIQGIIDGRRVAFTGDNLFADPDDPQQDGHEAVCARNSAILEEGYIYGSEYLRRLQPDLLMGGHSFVMNRPRELIERYHRWSLAIRDAYKELSAEEDYRYMFDPYWVRADPYRVSLARDGSASVAVHVRNFLPRPQRYRIVLQTPEGVTAEPAILEGTTPPEATVQTTLRLKAASETKPGVRIVALDATLDEKRYGPWFDLVVDVRPDK
jgi:glyoxylase-like metal-dependent hydrolase (beta-lactamase superfamily II)